MPRFETHSTDLKDLLAGILARKIHLPDFERG